MEAGGDGARPVALWVARHGERIDFTDIRWRQTAERPHDPPLSALGVEQAEALGRRLRGEGIAHVFSSPFLRAVETAFHVGEALDLPVRIEPGLCEWLNPEWFGGPPDYLPPAELAVRFPRIAADCEPLLYPSYPESWDEMVARTAAAALAIVDRAAGDVLLVGHGATVLGICQALPQTLAEEVSAPLCGLTRLVREAAAWRVVLAADTSHLGGPTGADRLV